MTEKYETLQSAQLFFERLHPNPKDKNIRTQLGVHFEEIAESMVPLEASDPQTAMMFHFVKEAVKALGEHLKTSEGTITIKDREALLDGLCDTIVTAVGVGKLLKMNVPAGFAEVMRSNFSKFGENGEPILDNNLKMVKGPFYTKPDLKMYI